MRWGWSWLVGLMTEGRCQGWMKMIGRGADGGCGTQEKACQASRASARTSAFPPPEEAGVSAGLDFYAQAQKVLSERSPFDFEDTAAPAVPTLPASLAGFLSKHSDSRKRHKKFHSHSGAEAKSSSKAERSQGSNIWAATEEYFRPLTLGDIERLLDNSSCCSLACRNCFLIPFPRNDNCLVNVVPAGSDKSNGANASPDANGVKLDCGATVREGGKEAEQPLQVDKVVTEASAQEENGPSVSQSVPLASSLEWLLGSRDKIFLASERPNKKRKLLGRDAGLEKLLVARPVEGNSTLCHICCLGDMNDGLNQLIVCGSCKVAVHEKCYGVRNNVNGSWLCSWCKHRNSNGNVSGGSVLYPCVLCPKQGGSLKPIYRSGGSAEFAHLFCSQWMPEVYIEDIRLMEPIMNAEGIKETRRKLICYLCRVKHGTCVRCSNGTCRTSFHPICAREAGHRLEIWGKLGCDTVELRAFCSKHSEVHINSTQQLGIPSAGLGSPVVNNLVTSSMNKPQMLKVGNENGDKVAVHIQRTDMDSDKLVLGEIQKAGMLDSHVIASSHLECSGAQEVSTTGTRERNGREDVNASDSLNFTLLLKKLIDRGKVDIKDVALEIGVAPELLSKALNEDCLLPDLRCNIVKWLKNHAHVGVIPKNLKVKVKSTLSSKPDLGLNNGSDAATISECDIPDVAVKSLPLRRITKNNVRVLRNNKLLCSSNEVFNDNGIVANEEKTSRSDHTDDLKKDLKVMSGNNKLVADAVQVDQRNGRDDGPLKGGFSSHAVDKIVVESVELHSSLEDGTPNPEGISCQYGNSGAGSGLRFGVPSDLQDPCSSVAVGGLIASDLVNTEKVSSSYVHPFIGEILMQLQAEPFGPQYEKSRSLEASIGSGVCCHQSECLSCLGKSNETDGRNLGQLVKAKNLGVLDLSPEDEVEGELIYFQHRLLCNVVSRKRFNDDLIFNVAKRLPAELDASRRRTWDEVLVNQYLCELRELKKQGRKERRHKEAQAILAAATAAAAASSRMSSFRKDSLDESVHQENLKKLNTAGMRSGVFAQLVPRAKETLPRVAVARFSSEKHSDYLQSTPEYSKEHIRTCDVCRRPETLLNPIIICSGCKVAVHLDCYRSVKDSSGPWYCELCVELSSKCNRAPVANSWEKPPVVVECGLCGGTTGAFRKSSDGQWIHAFCAEWVFESTFRRGQVSLIEGMETVFKGKDVCLICHRRHGVCIKCNYGHCQSTFHPSCARSSGLYMNVKATGGLLQHKAYCEKHSVEQRVKAETQKHGIEELKSMKQIRVELERLRLLCERIIKREKLKRELSLCSHEILASKRDAVAFSVLVHSPFFPHDVSSESATTSLRGHTDDYKSCSETIQRSDDITVDSTISSKRPIMCPISMEIDQKTDDSSTCHHPFVGDPMARAPFAGKRVPHRPLSVASKNQAEAGDMKTKPRKHTETFQKELIMTSDQASVKNQRLPKGYVYVPIGSLSSEKQVSKDLHSREPSEQDG